MWQFEVLNPIALSNAGGDYKDRIFEATYSWILGGFTGNLVNKCKDELVQRAMQEQCYRCKIFFLLDEGYVKFEQGEYHSLKIVDGFIYIYAKKDSPFTYHTYVGSKIENIL
eukprot:TRINITY_DN11359_c0_g1_i1.p1 TRINITY_DN11359_c0_g1~~TRINITY_DN11359_c0_g1_i1.p1  ORF type:complete len:112 (-),score=33.20 TRINITY_DN11359_c0_g1_i1:30-365(-)